MVVSRSALLRDGIKIDSEDVNEEKSDRRKVCGKYGDIRDVLDEEAFVHTVEHEWS